MLLKIKISFTYFILAQAAFAIDINKKLLDFKLKNQRQIPGELAVVLYEPVTGKIEYAYNKKLAYQNRYPPGSLLKVFSALYFLSAKKSFSPKQTVKCEGKFIIPQQVTVTESDTHKYNLGKTENGNHYLACNKTHGHVNLKTAISKSCNVYFLQQAVWENNLFYALNQQWFFSKPTLMQIPGFSEKGNLTKNPSALQNITAAIGEGGIIQATPLKIAQIFGSMWMDTPLLAPYEMGRPLMISANKMDPAQQFFIHSALSETLRTGTLSALKIKNKHIRLLGGKTGSATWMLDKYKTHAWNVLFFSLRGKKLVLVSFVNQGSGSREGLALSKLVMELL